MRNYNIFSWNINGIRAVYRKGFTNWLANEAPCIICLQEIRTHEKNLPDEIKGIDNYHCTWNFAKRPGYSGTGIISKEKPLSIEFGFEGNNDEEGRVITAKFKNFTIINCYVPNGRPDHSRVDFKLNFYSKLVKKCKKLSLEGEKVIICGDFNIAHKEIDVAKPKTKKNKTGFLKVERSHIDNLIEFGFFDVHRFFYSGLEGLYTWWSPGRNLKQRNIGWRFDYFFANKDLQNKITSSKIYKECDLSDHCPISISISV